MDPRTDYTKTSFSEKELVCFVFLAAAGGAGLGWLFFNSLKAALPISLILLAAGIPFLKKRKIKKQQDELLVEFRDMLYSISASISSGRNMTQAMEESIDFWESTYTPDDYIMRELSDMTERIRISNESDLTVLSDFAERSGLEDVKDFVNVYSNLKSSGGDISRAIERATGVIGDKISLESELKTLMAQKIFEGRIVGAAPFAVVLMVKLTSPEYLSPLTDTPKGQVIMGISLFLMGISLIMTEKINRIKV